MYSIGNAFYIPKSIGNVLFYFLFAGGDNLASPTLCPGIGGGYTCETMQNTCKNMYKNNAKNNNKNNNKI